MTTHVQPTSAIPQASPPTRLLQRACACGSKAGPGGACASCQRHKRPWQAKWRVNRPGDRWEQEAERVAHTLIAANQTGQLAHSGVEPRPHIPIVQRAPAGGLNAGAPVPEGVTAELSRLDGRGTPLPAASRAFFEPRLGHDFSQVRVHTDAPATQLAHRVGAEAFTTGQHIVFGAGRFQPETPSGRRLLAHELTHVVQQGAVSTDRHWIQRTACRHDGRNTDCAASLGRIIFEDKSSLAIDDTIVQNMKKRFGGVWITQVETPPNPRKSGSDSGRVDGVKVKDSGTLDVEVVEVKPRSLGLDPTAPTGGCVLATSQVDGYVKELTRIAPKVQELSQKLSKIGGYRLDGHHKPKNKIERGIFDTVGIPIDETDWFQAWAFYNSLQNRWPKVFTKSFSSVNIKANADGDVNQDYEAARWKVQCPKKGKETTPTVGIRTLVYNVNLKGGVSYGCQTDCASKKKEEQRKKQVEAQPIAQPEQTKQPQQTKQPETPKQVNVAPQLVKLYPDLREFAPGLSDGLKKQYPSVPPGTEYIIIAPPLFWQKFVSEPMMERTLDKMRVKAMDPRTNPVIGFRNLGWTLVGLTAASYVVVFSIGFGGALAAGGAGAAGAAGATGAAGTAQATGSGAVVISLTARLAAKKTAEKAISLGLDKAAGVLLVVGLAEKAEAAEDIKDVSQVNAVRVVLPSAVTPAGTRDLGEKVTLDGQEYYIVGRAIAR